MAYISQEEKQAIAPAVKALLKEYNLKGSLSIRNHSELVLTVTAGSIDFMEDANRMNAELAARRGDQKVHLVTGHIQVNPYWIETNHSGRAAEFLTRVVAALRGENWYDKSDIQSDYFHVKHYVGVNIGKWNKPYQLTA